VDTAGSKETALTHSGYSQGLACWSHSGRQILYIVSAIDSNGQYDLYKLNADGTGNRDIMPSYLPSQFLIHWAVFSNDNSAVYFIGEWWPTQ
jgi:Tol biopolymer transport system component